MLASLCSPALAAPRVALVIGSASYAHAPALANPLNDAADIGAALDRLGFAVTRLENAGYAALRQGLLEFQRAAAASEVAVVFYAGHGIEVDQRNFLVPVTAEQIAAESLYWESVKDSEDLWEFRAYPDRYPDGTYMVLARNRLKRLKVSAGGAASASAKSRGTVEAYSVTGESVWVQSDKSSDFLVVGSNWIPGARYAPYPMRRGRYCGPSIRLQATVGRPCLATSVNSFSDAPRGRPPPPARTGVAMRSGIVVPACTSGLCDGERTAAQRGRAAMHSR